MNKLFIIVPVLLLFVLGSCKKNEKCDFTDSPVIASASEQQALQDSLAAHGIQATKASAGFYYTIDKQGDGTVISNLCTNIAVYYKGSLFNGNVFDSTASGSPVVFQLGRVIPGWQKGIPLISRGGEITLYIPPSLGYGATEKTDENGNIIIPANSILIFHVELIDVQ